MADKSVMAIIRASRPSFRNNHDKIAFSVHAAFIAAGYALTATGPPAFSDQALSSPSTDEVGIENWNDRDDEYAFVYLNPEKGGRKVLVKCLAMNDKLAVDALAYGTPEPAHLEIDVKDYAEEIGSGNYSTQYKSFDKLVSKLNVDILSKLDGTTSKPSVSRNPSIAETNDQSRRNIDEPVVGVPASLGPEIHPSGIVYPPLNPIGGSDLFPGPGAGVYPTRGGIGGGSMLLGPNDPSWFGGVGGEPGFPGGQPGVPPGARFDPYGPPGVPGFEPGRFVRNPRRPGSGTHPDLEHFGGGSDFI